MLETIIWVLDCNFDTFITFFHWCDFVRDLFLFDAEVIPDIREEMAEDMVDETHIRK